MPQLLYLWEETLTLMNRGRGFPQSWRGHFVEEKTVACTWIQALDPVACSPVTIPTKLSWLMLSNLYYMMGILWPLERERERERERNRRLGKVE
jgi:hypothetical protein